MKELAGQLQADAIVPASARLHSRVMPLTSVFLFLYVVGLILFGENAETQRYVNYVGVVLAFLFVVELLISGRRLYFPLPLVGFLAFAAFCTFQMIWLAGSLSRLFTIFQLLVLATIVVNHETFRRKASAIEYGFYFGLICTFLYNIVVQQSVAAGRIGSTLGSANTYAFALLIGLLLAVRRLIIGTAKQTLSLVEGAFLLLFLALTVYGIVSLSGSRKGMLIAIAVVVVFSIYWVWQQPIRRRMLVSVLIVLLFGALAYFLYTSPLFARVADVSNLFRGGNVTDTGLVKRDKLLHDAIGLWLERPYAGWGFDQFRVISGWGTYAHDNYVEILANEGIIGLLIYLSVYVGAFLSLARSFHRSRDPGVSADAFWAMLTLGALVAWDLAAVSYYDKLYWILVGIVIGASVRARLQATGSRLRASPDDRGADYRTELADTIRLSR